MFELQLFLVLPHVLDSSNCHCVEGGKEQGQRTEEGKAMWFTDFGRCLLRFFAREWYFF